MRTGTSVIQNRCRIPGRCVFGGIRSTACLGKSNPLHSIPDTRPEARKSRKQCADLCEVGHRAVLRSQVRRFCKNLGFSWPVYSSLASSAKRDIVKVDKTRIVEISWESSDYSIQTSPRCPRLK